jgi:hypothetical protein
VLGPETESRKCLLLFTFPLFLLEGEIALDIVCMGRTRESLTQILAGIPFGTSDTTAEKKKKVGCISPLSG